VAAADELDVGRPPSMTTTRFGAHQLGREDSASAPPTSAGTASQERLRRARGGLRKHASDERGDGSASTPPASVRRRRLSPTQGALRKHLRRARGGGASPAQERLYQVATDEREKEVFVRSVGPPMRTLWGGSR
jgi:hypothetical protein